jgi:hypothetical protein
MMLVQVYLTVEEGADRVWVSTVRPVGYKPKPGRRGMVLRADIPVPDLERVDGVLRLQGKQIAMIDFFEEPSATFREPSAASRQPREKPSAASRQPSAAPSARR